MSSMKEKIGFADRVSYGYGRKVSDGNYGSHDVHVSYSSDVRSKETVEEALDRVQKVVERRVVRKMKKLKRQY